MLYTSYYNSPLGTISLQSNERALLGLDFVNEETELKIKREDRSIREESKSKILLQTVKELDEYFAGKRLKFTVPIYQEGTPFQVSVWKALTTIPYGKVKSYLDIATQVGNSKAVRAVGMTNGKNPIAIIVPCHRVIGKNGKMVGYASGVWRKEWLLAHEKKVLGN